MTIHAGTCWRQSRRRGGFDRGVTITAIQAIVADVVLMTKLDRLLRVLPLTSVPR